MAASGVALTVLLVLPWRWIAPPTTAFMWQDARGADRPVDQVWVAFDDIAPALPLAVIAAEDQKFPDHHGFDVEAIVDVVVAGESRGASTISQQVAKNLFLWRERSWVRKGLEAWLTVWIEVLWPKQRILEVHVNVAEFGDGVYGAEAASWRFFDRPPRELTERQAARLAAVLPSPRKLSAARPSDYVRQREREIRRQMKRLGGATFLRRLEPDDA